MNIRDRLSFHVPVQHAHTDETDASGPDSLDLRLGKELRAVYPESRYRIRMINTWRSLTESLEDCPLAVLDCSSMDPSKDLLASDQIVPSRAAEIYHLLHRSNHKWHWLSRQYPNELLLFVQFDTDKAKHARFCPHAAFINHDAPESAERRRSIECRSIVVTRLRD
ncbi:MAG: hypothetical protein M1840_000224 [Geoglossum simile]|nr:MAG: hypothetical protein M1840_000224 [Geoglossum simile]